MPTPSLQSLPQGYRALVIGATGTIGGANDEGTVALGQ